MKQRKSQRGTGGRYPHRNCMETLSVDTLLPQLEALLPQAAGTASLAFDGDGTLWKGDIGEDFLHAMIEAGDIRPVAVDAMRAVARQAGLAVPDRDAGVAVVRRLFDAYIAHQLAEDVICEVITWMCAGWRAEEVDRFAVEVLARRAFATRGHVELSRVLEWARGAGLRTFLVSASPRPIVEAAGAQLGFEARDILAVTAAVDAFGVVRPEVVRPLPYGPGKASLLATRLAQEGGGALLAAFGDNVFDVPMLEAAELPVVVDPKPRLLAHLAEHSLRGLRSNVVRLIVS